jgi:riboflavin synthase
MFTGIIEAIGAITEIQESPSSRTFWVESPLSGGLHRDQSLAHDGVCLTVEEVRGRSHRVTAIAETLKKTNLGDRKVGDLVNLERSLALGSRLDGHLVQGHVDSTAFCKERKELNGSWEFKFGLVKNFHHLVIEKGSICINGISLTLFDVRKKTFRVAIIPYTYEHTTMQTLAVGDRVNIEFDLIGKYISRNLQLLSS